jgi:hypothetical protein
MKPYCQNHNNFIESLLPNSSTPECMSTHGLDEYTFIHLLLGSGSKVYFPETKFHKLLAGHLFWEYLETRKDFRDLLFNGKELINGSSKEYNGDSIMNFLTDNLAFYGGYKLQKKLNLTKREFIMIFLLSNLAASKISLFRFG